MSALDNFLKIMKLNDEDNDDYYEDDDYLDDEDPKESKGNSSKGDTGYEEEKVRKMPARVAPIRQQPRKLNGAGMEVCVIKPTSVEDAREITETLLANRTVVLNLEGIEVDVAQRIIDFTSGSCYAISGNLQKISHYIFIITPASVDISGDFQEILSGSFDVPSIHN
ncbi:MAG: cell division protein SepF [Lachnospiraceae bacterium]|nr:cell division protein SepF [Lachnospiraceae bacterium]